METRGVTLQPTRDDETSKDKGSSSRVAEERDEGNCIKLTQATRCQYFGKMADFPPF